MEIKKNNLNLKRPPLSGLVSTGKGGGNLNLKMLPLSDLRWKQTADGQVESSLQLKRQPFLIGFRIKMLIKTRGNLTLKRPLLFICFLIKQQLLAKERGGSLNLKRQPCSHLLSNQNII